MCRLLFITSKKTFEIGRHLKTFADISKNSKEYQGHGWGCSYLNNNEWVHYHNINPIWKDDLEQFPSTDRLVVHARSAFQDKDIIVKNNMPFYDDQYVFIFNGELQKVKIKAEGRIGAEKIFNFIKRFDKGDMLTALTRGVEVIKKRTEYVRAMNIIIATKEEVFVSSTYGEDPDYFQMSKKENVNELVICSVAYPGEDGWQKIDNNYIGVYK